MMNIWPAAFSKKLFPQKALPALGISLLCFLFCPFLLFAAEQPGGDTMEAKPSSIAAETGPATISVETGPAEIPRETVDSPGHIGLTGNQEALSLTTTIFKTLGSLIIVIGLMLVLLFWVKKMGLVRTGTRQEGLITILDSQMLAPKKQVSVLEVAGAYLVIGLTDQQITLLATLDANDRLTEASRFLKTSHPLPASFAAILTRAVQGIANVKQKKKGAYHAE